ncbi:6-bladed beta-propeller [Bdellovibrio bacteriovorus]
MYVTLIKILLVFLSLVSAGCSIDASILKDVVESVEAPSQDDPTPVTPALHNTFPIGGAKAFYTLPMSIHLTNDGKMFVTGYQDLAMGVQKYDLATGEFIFGFGEFGNNNATNTQFDAPERIIEDPSGRILVIERYQDKIKVFDSTGNYLTSIGSIGANTLDDPTDIAIDKNGLMYVCDSANHRILVANADGSYNRTIGSGGTGAGQLQFPTGVDVDENLNVYVADRGNKRVQIFKADNTIVSIGTAGTNPGQLNWPYRVRVNSLGDIFVSERTRYEIIKYSANGTLVGYYTGNPASPFNELYDFEMDENDNIYATSTLGGVIQVIDKNGNYIKTLDKSSLLGGLLGVFIDADDNIYTTQGYMPNSNQYIYKFNSSGQQLARYSEYGTNPGQLQYAVASVVDEDGNIYTTDMFANKASKFDKDGNFVKLIGTGQVGPNPGEFQSISGLCYRDGVLYITDGQRGDVQKFDTDGAYLGVIGTTPGPGDLTSASTCYIDAQKNLYVADQVALKIYKYDENEAFVFSFAHPATYGVYVDTTGNIYATDLMGNKVNKYDSGGNLIISFGQAGFGLGDLNGPTGIAGDSKGNIFVGEAFGKRLQKFSPLGIPLTE